MNGVTLILIAAGLMLAVGLLTVLAWFVYTTYLERVERKLETRKGLYRELVSELATRDRALLEPTIHQMRTLYDLDALEAVLEEQARTATGRPSWLLAVYDQLGLVDKYIEKLRRARKWRDRAFAAELLGRVGGANAVPALLETVRATQTEDSDVREIALRALARIADPGAVEPLVVALGSAEAWLAPRIADILARHGEVVVDPLIALLGNHSAPHPARAWAANVLGEVKAQRAFPALVSGLDLPDDEVRAKSATALGRLGDRRAVPHLFGHLLTDPAPFVRARIANTLGRFDGPEVIDHLVRALGDPAWWVRMRGVEALEQIGPAAEGPLLIALDDPDPGIMERAAVSLERLGVPRRLAQMVESGKRAAEASDTLSRFAVAGTRELLAELLHHRSSRVREVVLAAVLKAGRRDLAAELIRLATDDSDPSLRALALDSLRVLRLAQGIPAATARTNDGDPRVRAAAIRLLADVGGSDMVELLRAYIADSEPTVRATVIRALGRLGGSRAQSDVFRLLSDPEAIVREAAVTAAADAGLQQLAPSLLARLTDNEEGVRLAAVRAVGVLGDSSLSPALVRTFEDASPRGREAVALALSRLDPEALSPLSDRLFQSGDAAGRMAIARTAARLRSPAAIEVLRRLVHDPEPEVRAEALEALGRCARVTRPGSDSVVPSVTDGLSDPHQAVRAAAVDLCARMCLLQQGHQLLSMLQNDPSPVVRERAAIAIGLMRTPGGEEALIGACRGAEPPNLRAAAALGAGAFNRESLVTLIVEMPDSASVRELLRRRLKHDPQFRLLSRALAPARGVELRALAASSADRSQVYLADGVGRVLDAGERIQVIGALRAFQGERSRDALLQMLRGDPSPVVRTAALAAIGELLDPDELLAFGGRALGDPSMMVRRAALSLFARVPADRAFPRLLQGVRPDDDPAMLAAVAALAEEHFSEFQVTARALPPDHAHAALVARVSRYIQHPELPELLLPFARSPAPEVREAVAELWRYRPELADQGALEALIQDPVIAVRLAAAGAAAAAERYDLLDRLTQDPDAGVRREVALTLGRTAPIGKAGFLVLDHLESDAEMAVRAAAYAARLLQGTPVPLPPGLDPRVTAEAVQEAADLPTLRNIARTTPGEERRLAAALALALLQDDVAREVARTDPAPAIRHRVGGTLELSMASPVGGSS